MASKPTCLVFGASGAVGSATALSAHSRGSKVFLALRDTSKPTPNLPSSLERIQADLSSPSSISAAVKATGATHAFIYTIFSTPDSMLASLTALKAAGITFVVQLSSDYIREDVNSIPKENALPYAHASVEVNLQKIFGAEGYVAVRPGWFASNPLRLKSMIQTGVVETEFPDAKFDYISPSDIGLVCGSLLVSRPKSNVVRLNGPKMLSQRQALAIISKALGREIKIVELDEETAVRNAVERNGLPESMARAYIGMVKGRSEEKDGMFSGTEYEEAWGNIEKLGGKKATGFEEWVEGNKEKFA